MDYVIRLLSRRAYTSYEIRVKLQKRPGYTEKLGSQVLQRLSDLDLINDVKYIRNSLELNFRHKHRGFLRVAQDLKRRGLKIDDVRKIWDSEQISEQFLAEEALRKSAKKFEKYDAEAKFRKAISFLATKGFKPGVIFKVAKSFTKLESSEF